MSAEKGEQGTIPLEEMFKVCPVCGGGLQKRPVEKVLRRGGGTITPHPEALVCLRCGEVYYHESTVRQFEEVRRGLREET